MTRAFCKQQKSYCPRFARTVGRDNPKNFQLAVAWFPFAFAARSSNMAIVLPSGFPGRLGFGDGSFDFGIGGGAWVGQSGRRIRFATVPASLSPGADGLSLQNIYKELQSDLSIPPPSHGCLTAWAEQGVLPLNATFTVRAGEPLSHHKKGWEEFTDAIIEAVARRRQRIVFCCGERTLKKSARSFLRSWALILS